MAENNDRAEAVVAEIQKKINDAFKVFDHDANNTVDVREVGTIIRSLGCCPSEAELHNIIAEIEEEEPTRYIRFEKFLPMMTKVLMERKYRPIPEDLLIQAFEILDQQKKGYLNAEELVKYMTQEDIALVPALKFDPLHHGLGEPFTQEEMDEMLSAALDPNKNVIFYNDFVSMMTIEDKWLQILPRRLYSGRQRTSASVNVQSGK